MFATPAHAPALKRWLIAVMALVVDHHGLRVDIGLERLIGIAEVRQLERTRRSRWHGLGEGFSASPNKSTGDHGARGTGKEREALASVHRSSPSPSRR